MKKKVQLSDSIINPRDETVMRAYRFTTVEFQKLQLIAADKRVDNTHVLSSLIKWYWNEHMQHETPPKPVPPDQLKSAKRGKPNRR